MVVKCLARQGVPAPHTGRVKRQPLGGFILSKHQPTKQKVIFFLSPPVPAESPAACSDLQPCSCALPVVTAEVLGWEGIDLLGLLIHFVGTVCSLQTPPQRRGLWEEAMAFVTVSPCTGNEVPRPPVVSLLRSNPPETPHGEIPRCRDYIPENACCSLGWHIT